MARAVGHARTVVRRARASRATAKPLIDAVSERPSAAPMPDSGPASDALFARLTEADLAEIEAALEGDLRALWERSSPQQRRYQALLAAAWYDLAGPLERTGLSSAAPPDEVHAMARGPLAAGGDPGLADLVLDALTRTGHVPPERGVVLDFGCSSGRVARVIAAVRPDLRVLGCDPNADAVAWADAHLPGRFFPGPLRPPLPLADGEVDAAYAISVWSHFAPGPAEAWLREMHRVIRPGGGLVLTTHGPDALAVRLREGRVGGPEATAIGLGLLRGGAHFVDTFAGRGDWGVRDPGWGDTYLTLDWLAARATPAWSIALYEAGRLQAFQDVIVLSRRG